MRPPLSLAAQRGSSMIEVLVSLTLVAVVMLGLLALQLRSASFQKDSFDRRKAATIVAAFGERVAANYEGFELASYSNLTFGPSDEAPAAVSACTGCTNAQLAARDWDQFRIAIRQQLPGGVAFMDTPANMAWLSVVVGWMDVRRPEVETGGAIDPVCQTVGINDVRYRCYAANIYP
jgi:type IV pilus assembly protein PilV